MNYQAVSLKDRVDIDNLFSAYVYAIDDGDAGTWISLFTAEGAFIVPGLDDFVGQEGLRSMAEMVINGSQGHWRHMATNILVTPTDSADAVNVRLRTLVTDWSTEPAGLQFNDYTGELVKQNGVWKINTLTVIPSKVIV